MNQAQLDALFKEVHRLNPSPVIELYELDVRPCGDDSVLFFHNGTGGRTVLPSPAADPTDNSPLTVNNIETRTAPIVFKGVSYFPLPIQVTGFDLSSTGEPARPAMSIMNLGGFMSSLILKTKDLVGAKLTRRRTFARFLDGEPEASPIEYPVDIFTVVRKTNENRLRVEFELGSDLDLDGVKYPTRTVVSNYCQHLYRGPGCNFSGQYVVANSAGIPEQGVLKFRGYWNAEGLYTDGDSVWFVEDGVSSLYGSTSVAGVSGHANRPTNTAHWKRLQRFRGPYVATADDYVENDVVYLVGKSSLIFYKAIVPAVPEGVTPPNSAFWASDTCSKLLTQCRWRFDPRNTGMFALPFGGFPGLLTIPEVA